MLLISSCALFILCLAWTLFVRKNGESAPRTVPNPYRDITPLPFDWKEQEHIKIRNFKDIYHLTMGLQSCDLNDLVLMDRTYEAKIQIRRDLIVKRSNDVIGFNPVAREAVEELYEWLFSIYLPQRFPTAFAVEASSTEKGSLKVTRNLMTGETVSHDTSDPKDCLRIIGQHVDCEFSILLPVSDPVARLLPVEPTTEPKEAFHLHAFVLAFPSGFNTARKLGLPLAGIHGPVPGYSIKLEKSMDRYFANLPFGKVVQRSNWSISTDSVLFKLGEMHTNIRSSDHGISGKSTSNVVCRESSTMGMAPATYTPTQEELAKWSTASALIDPVKCSLRMERQTLHRLERTGALVFGFKTFLEPLSKLKKEGSGPQLARALDGMRLGSVPAMDVYKDGVIWRKPLIEYLTS